MVEQKQQQDKQTAEKKAVEKKQGTKRTTEKQEKQLKQSRSRKKAVNESRRRANTKKETTKTTDEENSANSTVTIDLSLQEVAGATTEGQLVHRLDATMITIDGSKYEIIKDYRDAFDAERLGERYSEILDKYDYVVADWGFEQLRLKGFYDNRNRKVPQDQRISNLEDYLYEYCNFGCPYFVLQRLEAKKGKSKTERADKAERPARKRKSQKAKNPTNQKSERPTKSTETHVAKETAPKTKSTKPKREFIKKEITPQSTEKVEKIEKKEKAVFETVQDNKGKRHFSIRRKDADEAKNKN
ncbi:MAG: YutD family protein [Carnobacterium sp.]|uniref:YutD family protein n=1 Tax=Carnobacterium sp. TaxID=48221 RepID=UPI002FC9F221